MIRDYILLPHMLTMVQRSIDDINRSNNLLKKLYAMSAQVVMDRISKDMFDLRRELSRRNIKVYDDETVDIVVYYRYFCRGYEDRFGIVRDVMRSEISIRLTRYVTDVLNHLKEDTSALKKE
jgi:adenylate kinase family enzyme